MNITACYWTTESDIGIELMGNESVVSVFRFHLDPNPSFRFIKTPQETEAPVGQTVVLEAATDSPAVFTWFKDGEEIFM